MAHRFSFDDSYAVPNGKGKVGVEVEEEGTPVVEENVPVTPAMFTEAAEAVLEGADPAHAEVMRRLWTADTETDAARMLFQSEVAARSRSLFTNWDKPDLVLTEALTTEQMADFVAYAPEFNLIFRNSVGHDHGTFAAARKIDHKIVEGKYPPNMPYGDIGGNVMYHVKSGHRRCKVIAPQADAKDPNRATLTDMELRRILREGARGGWSADTLEMARSVVDDDQRFVVRALAQNADVKVRATMSVHVYDISMDQWPMVMENLGSVVHEGCLFFSNEYFEASEGVLQASGARYRIDESKDEFHMGLGSSRANWYTHRWSDYMKYGADQILFGRERAYSYKVIERRGDTLFFRIMEIDASAQPNRKQVYRLPTMEMVEVHGFDVGPLRQGRTGAAALVPRSYTFPYRLWNNMVSYAKMELDRGGLDYNKMFNYYRTVVPRQSINSVTVSGGQKVEIDQVPALIVMAAAVASVDIAVLDQSLKAVTSQIHDTRSERERLAVLRLIDGFYKTVVMAGYMLVSPFEWLGLKIEALYLRDVSSSLVSWKPMATIKRVPLALIVDNKAIDYDYLPPRDPGHTKFIGSRLLGRDLNIYMEDPVWAKQLLDSCGEALPADVLKQLRIVVSKAEDAKADESAQAAQAEAERPDDVQSQTSSLPTYKTEASKMSPEQVQERRAERIASVREALEESKMEADKLQAACHVWCRQLLAGNKPSPRDLKAETERMGNPDLWWVDNGVIVSSVLGQDPVKFDHSGVFTFQADPETGSNLRAVYDRKWSGIDRATGEHVTRVHHYIRDAGYTGYALTVDELHIFNGPEMRVALELALKLPPERFDAYYIGNQGPPGCGKTTAIVKQAVLGSDMVVCPARKSLRSTREKLKAKFPGQDGAVFDATRTLDSLLVNWMRTKDKFARGNITRLLADECYIVHSGKWNALVALLGVRVMQGYGDKFQIPPFSRVDAPQRYKEWNPDTLKYTWLVYRSAPKIVAMWNHIYDWKVRSVVEKSATVRWVRDYKAVQLVEDHMLLCMYQADKKTIQALYGGRKDLNILTTHEAQGEAYDQIVLFNFETRVRSSDDKFYLFAREAYNLVASSRARFEFTYVKQAPSEDMITEWIKYSEDPRKVSVAADVRTAGQSVMVA